MIAEIRGDDLVVPGLASAHSHAFQRGLRFRTQRRASAASSFWSWRGLMYRFADALDPDNLYQLSHFAYVELARAGVTAVGEFHYVHHQRGGVPYEQRTLLADTVIRAARDAGLRIALLRVLYHRAGHGRAAEGAQQRFCDPSIDRALADVDDLRTRYAGDPMVAVGVAPHSLRAVPLDWVRAAHDYTARHGLPLHMHVAEQRRELDECRNEHGATPVQVLADAGVLSDRFVAVHATHLDAAEIAALGQARAFVCLCRTTERDLGDGACSTADLIQAGARLCFGVDSHAVSDPFEEARAAELDERTRQEARHAAASATDLLAAATDGGYRAIGLSATGDEAHLSRSHVALAGATADVADDAIVFAGSPAAVRTVRVAGQTIVADGAHPGYEGARAGYERALSALVAR